MTRSTLIGLVLLASCAPGQVQEASESGAPTTIDSDTFEPGETIEEVPGLVIEDSWPERCSDLYPSSSLSTFELEISDDVWAAIQSDCSNWSQTYRPVVFSYLGESVSAMARLKGNWSWSCDKLQFIISFNEEDPDGRFHGVRKVVLDAPWYDHSLLHERLAFSLFEERGLPYSCANNARLVINDEYYGLYANVERIDHEYLERHFEEYEGNLYQGGSELKTNEDVYDTSDIEALNAAHGVDEIAALVDLDQAVAEWSMEAMIPAMDNYWAGVEINYYLYNHPSQGFVYLPYDLDISFGDAAYTDGSLVWPYALYSDPIHYEHSGWRKEALVETVLADPWWCSRFVEELELSRAAFVPEELIEKIETWDAQIRAELVADPHKTFSDSQHTAAIAHLQTFVTERAAFVDSWLEQGGHCPGE
jgi:hypothetical protein